MKMRIAVEVFSLILCCACTSKSSIVSSPNPWEDNYESIASMENYRQWGTYNVHDPACKKFGDTYYMYSTDAIFAENRKVAAEKNVPLGYIQVRKSKDLVHWDFCGWAFPEIPTEAVEWVRLQNNNRGAYNIWAPYIIQYGSKYRLYYCVSAFGRRISYIGLAESSSPEGPWTQCGCVVKTNNDTPMNAIDPSVIADPQTGKWWMHYGSYFGGLYCVELNPDNGLPLKEGDHGHLTARRANYKKDNLEAPEIIYHPELQKYFLFVSYDPLMTTYNVRVGGADKAEGPFEDLYGNPLADTTNNFPMLTAPYRFDNHSGWAGTGHCGVVDDGVGHYFMLHQGRLAPQNQLMVLHVRRLFFTSDGWPCVSPERYAGECLDSKVLEEELLGEWEVIRMHDLARKRGLEDGQVLYGEGSLKEGEFYTSKHIVLGENEDIWKYDVTKGLLELEMGTENIKNLIIFRGHDWENQTETVLFTGICADGCAVWGKKVK